MFLHYHDLVNGAFARINLLLAFIGLFVASMLGLSHVLHIELPCGIGSGCETVTQDPRSHVLGVPIAFWGVLGYGLFTLISGIRTFAPGWKPRMMHGLGYALSGLSLILSVALTMFSLRVLHSFCTWCLGSAVVISLLFVSHAWEASRGEPGGRRWTMDVPFVAVLLFSYVFGVTMGVGNLKAEAATPRVDKVELRGIAEADLLPARAHIRGPKEAKAVVVMFGDLTCPVCQHAYLEIDKLMETRHDFRLAFRHLPLTIHEMSKPAALVSEMAAEKGHFWEFVKDCYSGDPYSEAEFAAIAARYGVAKQECMRRLRSADDPIEKLLTEDREVTDRLDLHSTPSCFILIPGYYPEPIHSNGIAQILDDNGGMEKRKA